MAKSFLFFFFCKKCGELFESFPKKSFEEVPLVFVLLPVGEIPPPKTLIRGCLHKIYCFCGWEKDGILTKWFIAHTNPTPLFLIILQ
jgi:hypothetical protein